MTTYEELREMAIKAEEAATHWKARFEKAEADGHDLLRQRNFWNARAKDLRAEANENFAEAEQWKARAEKLEAALRKEQGK